MSLSVMMLNKINIHLGNLWLMRGHLYTRKSFTVTNFLERGLLKTFRIPLSGYLLRKLFNLSKLKEFSIKKKLCDSWNNFCLNKWFKGRFNDIILKCKEISLPRNDSNPQKALGEPVHRLKHCVLHIAFQEMFSREFLV